MKNETSAAIHGEVDSAKWLTVKDAAAYLRTTASGIRNMVYRDQLPSYKLHGRILFKRTDLDRLIESSRRE